MTNPDKARTFNMRTIGSTVGMGTLLVGAVVILASTKSPYAPIESDKIDIAGFINNKDNPAASITLNIPEDTKVDPEKIPERLEEQRQDVQDALLEEYPKLRVGLGSIACTEIAPLDENVLSFTCRAQTVPLPANSPSATPTK